MPRTHTPDDGHPHNWVEVPVPAEPNTSNRARVDTRCSLCWAFRCGGTWDADPCLDRLAHTGKCVRAIAGLEQPA
jgi:hypothetical protein